MHTFLQFAATLLGQELLATCSVVVGLHPDEATDAIVRVATAHNKPWVVVPCCTFRKKFPHRRLPDGRPVWAMCLASIFVQRLCWFLVCVCVILHMQRGGGTASGRSHGRHREGGDGPQQALGGHPLLHVSEGSLTAGYPMGDRYGIWCWLSYSCKAEHGRWV